jgi:hypothetical protein
MTRAPRLAVAAATLALATPTAAHHGVAAVGVMKQLGPDLTWLAEASYERFGARRAALARLNERADEQGSERLERFRAALTLGYSTGF